MAEKKALDPKSKVKIKLFKDNGKYSNDVFVAVNGNTFVIQRGVEVEVPLYVKEVLDNTERAEKSLIALQDSLTADLEKKSKELA